MIVTIRGLVLVAVSLLLLVGCTSTSSQDERQADLTLISPYLNKEAGLLAETVEMFEAESGLTVDVIGVGGLANALDRALSDGVAVDVALLPQPALVREMASNGVIVPLDPLVEESIAQHYDEQTAAVGSFQGELYAVWFRADVNSLIWHSPRVFQERGWEIPQTLGELEQLVEEVGATDLKPWCMTLGSFSATGWPATDWIEDLVLRLAGPQAYDDWVNGSLAFTSSFVRPAFEQFDQLLNQDNVYGGRSRALGAPFQAAVSDLAAGRCAMLHFGLLTLDLLPPNVIVGPEGDLNAFLLPDVEPGDPPLLVAGELAVGLNERPETTELLNFFATPKAGEVWAAAGGYLPPYADFNLEILQTQLERDTASYLSQAEVVRFDGSDLMPRAIGTGLFWEAMLHLVEGQALDSVLCNLDLAWSNLLGSGDGARASSREISDSCFDQLDR